MTVAELMKKLATLDPAAVVVTHHQLGVPGQEGYDDVWFVEGTHSVPSDTFGHRLRDNRKKFVKGVGKADYLPADPRSKAKKLYSFVVLS